MKGKFKLSIIGALVLTAAVGLISQSYAPNVVEDTTDAYNNVGIDLRKVNIGASEEISVSPTYVQYGSQGARQFLRFATAISGPVKSVKYTRIIDGLGSKDKEVSIVYKGIQAGDAVYYYDGSDTVTTPSELTDNYYWACYTIEFSTNTYKSSDITAFVTVESDVEGSEPVVSAQKTSSFDTLEEAETIQYIYTVDQLKRFRDKVNSGTNYKGKTIKLMDNIDLANENWTPIGTDANGFMGTFDGGNYTISNFTVETKQTAGLFGYALNGGNVKNLRVENAYISAHDYAGAIMGRGYTDIDNCHVKNVTVVTKPYLTAEGKYDGGAKAGGVIGQMLEGSGNTVTNCSATDVKIYAFRDLGGVVGMVHNNNSASGNTASNVTLGYILNEEITADKNGNAGAIYGRVQSTATVSPKQDSAENQAYTLVYAIVDELSLVTLANQVNSGNTYENKTVVLVNDLEVTGLTSTYFTVNNTELNFDLNGHSLSFKTATTADTKINAFIVKNGGKLIINDSSSDGTGELSMKYLGSEISGGGFSISSNVVELSEGSLVVNGGNIVNYTERITGVLRNTIDCTYSALQGNSVVINDGTIYCVNGYAIRSFASSTTSVNSITINDGVIKGTIPVYLQSPNANHNLGKLVVNGGEFVSYVPWNGSTLKPIEFCKDTDCANGSDCKVIEMEVELNNGFTADDVKVSESTHINIKTAVLASSEEEFVSALSQGDNVRLTSNIELTDSEGLSIVKDSEVTINLAGNNIDASYNEAQGSALFVVNQGGKLNLTGNGTINYTAVSDATSMPSYSSNVISNCGNLVIDNVTLINNSIGSASFCIDNYEGAELVINGGTFTQTNGKYAVRMVASSNSLVSNVTINDGTFNAQIPVWLQLAGSNSEVAPTVNFTINGGTFNSTRTNSNSTPFALYTYSFGNSFANTNITINGGYFNGYISLGLGANDNIGSENLVVTGGEFAPNYGCFRFTPDGSDVTWIPFPSDY